MNNLTHENSNNANLRVRYLHLKQQKNLRTRDAAHALGVSEAELVACNYGEHVVRLHGPYSELIKQLPELGKVMALTRNESVVHEKIGIYPHIFLHRGIGLAIGGGNDLRIHFKHWQHGFAITENRNPVTGQQRHSLQFFDANGDAVHKVFLQKESNVDIFYRIVTEFAAKQQHETLAISSSTHNKQCSPDHSIDVATMRTAWSAMQDTHEFSTLLTHFGAERHQAFRLIGSDFAYQVNTTAVRELIRLASFTSTPMMIFVSNHGMLQIHTGPIDNIVTLGHWLNIIDPEFNLHLREDHIAHVWIVKKPTKDGIVTSLEVFNAEHENIALFFGMRRSGQAELPQWRAIISQISQLDETSQLGNEVRSNTVLRQPLKRKMTED